MRREEMFERRHRVSARIPSVSMGDIAFLLLIFFMATTIFRSDPGIQVRLPEAQTGEKHEKEQVLHVWIDQNSRVWINERPVARSQVSDWVVREMAAKPGLVVAFNTMLDRLELAFAGLSEYSANLAHELRTPLNAILGYAEMFKEAVYGPMNDKQVNMADRIMKNTQRLLGLINDLLDQAQMEAGKLTIHIAPLRPAELLDALRACPCQDNPLDDLKPPEADCHAAQGSACDHNATNCFQPSMPHFLRGLNGD